MNYQERLKNFSPEENTNCPNYVQAIQFAKANGFSMSKDVSYNGYIYFEKIICGGEHKLEIQIYDGIMKDSEHSLCQCDLEADFGQSILSKTRYWFKPQRYKDERELNDFFELVLNTEKELC